VVVTSATFINVPFSKMESKNHGDREKYSAAMAVGQGYKLFNLNRV
jgi:hypothetical protein